METAEILQLLVLIMVLISGFATVWWRLSAKISGHVAELHRRINDTRETYVRGADLMLHIARIEDGQKVIIAAVDRVNQRIDHAMAPRQQPLQGSEI